MLDVIIALVVLALSGVGLIGALGQTAHTMRSVRTTERETRLASAELDRFVAYDRAGLLTLVGTTTRGDWTITVSQATTELFDVAVARSGHGVPLLATTVYRPDTTTTAGQ